jgi:hypothetical protein
MTAHAGGRPRNTSTTGLTAEQWLTGYLSGGSRPTKEIREVGELQGFGWRTVERAKARLGISSKKVGHQWHWKDGTVPDAKPKSQDKLDVLTHKLDEFTRLSQSPNRQTSADGPVSIDLNAVDEDGYLKASPGALGLESGDVTVLDVINRINSYVREGRPHDQVVRDIFSWAYPAAGIAESTLKSMLRANNVKVGPKQTASSEISF